MRGGEWRSSGVAGVQELQEFRSYRIRKSSGLLVEIPGGHRWTCEFIAAEWPKLPFLPPGIPAPILLTPELLNS